MNDKPQHHYSNPQKKNLSGYCDNDMCASCKVEWCDCDCHKKVSK